MNKNKIKKFFTLKHRPDAGFTLVELVIVIAILAILAGVAVPIYGGYTTKAREAADQMIIAAANDALAAACMENKVDVKDVTEASVSVVGAKIAGLSSVATASKDLIDDAAGYFMTYLGENKDSTFKTPNVNSLVWYQAETTFKVDSGYVAARVVLSNGKTVTVPADAMEAISNSFIGDLNPETLGEMFEDIQDGAVTTLVGTVDDMVDQLCDKAGVIGGAILKRGFEAVKKVTDEEQFGAYIALQSDGLKNNTEIFGDRYSYISDTLGSLSASKAEKEAAMNEFTNSMLLYTAGTLGNGKQDAGTIQTALIGNYNSDTNLVSTGGNGAKVVSAAIRESVYQAYLKTDEGAEAYANASGTDAEKKAALTAGEGFATYLESDQCKNDIDGLIASMETVQNNKNNIGVNELVQQGMSNEDALKIFGAITTG